MVALATKTWYLSFVDDQRVPGNQWLGACIVEGCDMADAVRNSHRLGCNPGGEVMIILMPPDTSVPSEFCNRLLTIDDVRVVDRLGGGNGFAINADGDEIEDKGD